MKKRKVTLRPWGNYPTHEASFYEPASLEELKEWMTESPVFIPAGNFRSYGDAALSDHVLSTLSISKKLQLDEEGILRVSAGVTLDEVMRISVPKGWFFPVTPGTKYVTIGGAIAADVHGKNHHKDGCLSNFVLELDLLLPEGKLLTCSPEIHSDLFWATCGGMGLTGVIVSASIKMLAIESQFIRKETIPTSNLEETLKVLQDSKSNKYSVAWLDTLAKGSQLGKGVIFNGRHCLVSELSPRQQAKALDFDANSNLSVPFYLPGFTLNKWSVKAFNNVYYWRNSQKSGIGTEPMNSFFYPLDGVNHWNRIYGRKGFLQFQCVLPEKYANEGMKELLEKISDYKGGSFLAVLKLMGPGQPKSPLHFPMEGLTLALDFPRKQGLFELFHQLDDIVLKNQGRIYLAKDAAMSKEIFDGMYPGALEFGSKYVQSDKMNSLLWERLS